MKQGGSLIVYFVRDDGDLLTGRLVERGFSWLRFVATGVDAEQLYADLGAQVGEALKEDPDCLDAFLWEEDVHTERVEVEVRPQLKVEKRSVIGRDKIPLLLTYGWAALKGERADSAAGYRVMLPRFGFWYLLEDLALAPEVLRESVSSALAGESPRSVFEFRAAKEEYFESFRPKALRKKRGARSEQKDGSPILNQVAEDWTALARAGKLGAHIGASDFERQTRLLRLDDKPSLLVVGPPGAGKTEWVRELARRAAAPSEGSTPTKVWATSADRIMAGMTYLGMWEQRCLEIVVELAFEGDFLYVESLTALTETQSGESSIADLLLPALSDGEISVIAECTEREYERLLASAPTLVGCFELVRLSVPSPEDVALLIAEYQARHAENGRLHPDAIRRLVQKLALFRRDHEFPGKAFAFLEWLRQERTSSAGPAEGADEARALVHSPRDADRLFSRYTGLPEKLVSDDELGSPEELARILERGVVGQSAACRICAEVLTRFKAGVSDPEKPLGSLLFVGPTGVGKTELAKELARFMFGGAERMVRLDMSEYMMPGATFRLLSDERSASSLLKRVSEAPLSLILLDEIEKAHPAVFDLLLGVLGEGRLTASSGRLVDFRMTLIVMTSNLGTGAERAGFGRPGADPRDALRAVREHFRPEFFNRLDYVVPFQALTPEAVRRIVELELDLVQKREGLARRNLRLAVSDGAKARLAELGYHPKYGARPLKRAIEALVMTPIAIELSRRPKLENLVVQVREEHGRILVAFQG